MGRRQGPPGWGKRGLQSGPCRQAVRPKGRRGSGPLRGQRAGTAPGGVGSGGFRADVRGDGSPGPAGNGPGRRGKPRGGQGHWPQRRQTGAAPRGAEEYRLGGARPLMPAGGGSSGPVKPPGRKPGGEPGRRRGEGGAVRHQHHGSRRAPEGSARADRGPVTGAGTGAARPSSRPPCHEPGFRRKGQGGTPAISLAGEGANRQKGRNSARYPALPAKHASRALRNRSRYTDNAPPLVT